MSTQIQFPLMPPFRFSWVAVILAALFAAALVPAFACAGGADASRFIEAIYAHGHEDAVWSQWLDSAKRGAWFSRDLTALWNQCDASASQSKDQVGALDFGAAVGRTAIAIAFHAPQRRFRPHFRIVRIDALPNGETLRQAASEITKPARDVGIVPSILHPEVDDLVIEIPGAQLARRNVPTAMS